MAKSTLTVKINDKQEAWDAELPILDWQDFAEPVQVRLIGEHFSAVRHWVKFKAENSPKGSKSFPEWCLNFNPESEEFKKHNCPLCAIPGAGGQRLFLMNVILRSEQEAYPKDPKKFLKVVAFSPKMMEDIINNSKINKHAPDPKDKATKVAFPVEHPTYGVDLLLKYDSNSKNPVKHFFSKDVHSPLTPEEKALKLYNFASMYRTRTVAEIERSIASKTLLSYEGKVIREASVTPPAARPKVELDTDDDVPTVSASKPTLTPRADDEDDAIPTPNKTGGKLSEPIDVGF